ncbi:TPA: glycerophosphodiester phosphodiesterase [Streptococcus suis]
MRKKLIIGVLCIVVVINIILGIISHNFIDSLQKEFAYISNELSTIKNSLSSNSSLFESVTEELVEINTTEASLEAESDSLEKQLEYPIMISHRGYNTVAPEETAVAYQKAIEDGFTHLEGDIRFTLDGVPVMHHDESINNIARNADGTRLSTPMMISEHTYDELNQYDYGLYKGEEYRGTKLLTFEEFMDLSQSLSVEMVHVELKTMTSLEQKQVLFDIVKRYEMTDKVGWGTFKWEDFSDFDVIAPTAQLEVLAGSYTNNLLEKLYALSNGQRKVVASISSGISKGDVKTIIDSGFEVYVWTINQSRIITSYQGLGVTGFMTDDTLNIDNEIKGELRSRDNAVRGELQKVISEKEVLLARLKKLELSIEQDEKVYTNYKEEQLLINKSIQNYKTLQICSIGIICLVTVITCIVLVLKKWKT